MGYGGSAILLGNEKHRWVLMIDEIIPEQIRKIALLTKSNIVGGAIRDYFMGKNIHDYDLATPLIPEEIISILTNNGYKPILTGVKYGTVSIILDGIENPVEITTYRSEKYSGNRFPDVSFHTNQKGDLMRRDFTINAMAYDVRNKEIIDPYGGLNDIKEKRIEFVGNPEERIMEDPLRIIRACRLSASLGFTMTEKTSNAIMKMRYELKSISKDRMIMELMKANKYFYQFIPCIMKHHLTEYILGYDFTDSMFIFHDERGSHYGESIFVHIMDGIRRADEKGWYDFPLRIAILFHDIGKMHSLSYDGGVIHFIGHENWSVDIFRESIGTFTGLDRRTKNQIEFLIQNHMKFPLLETKKKIIKTAIDWKMEKIPISWIENLSKLAYADRGTDFEPLMQKIRKIWDIEQPNGLAFLKYKPEQRKEMIRQSWIDKVHKVMGDVQ